MEKPGTEPPLLEEDPTDRDPAPTAAEVTADSEDPSTGPSKQPNPKKGSPTGKSKSKEKPKSKAKAKAKGKKKPASGKPDGNQGEEETRENAEPDEGAPEAEAGASGRAKGREGNGRSDTESATGPESEGDGDGEGPEAGPDQPSKKKGKAKAKGKDRDKGRQKPEPQLGPPMDGEGILEISGKGFGFLRQRSLNFKQTPNDIFVTPETVRKFGLRDGMWIEGEIREGNRGPQLTELRQINGRKPEKYMNLPVFEELTAINPNKRIHLETDPKRYSTRLIDMMSPIGRGQRGLIVAPPRTGKTTLLQHIAEGVLANHEGIKLILLLVDERPEEVTELSRSLPEAELFASSNDSDVKSHTRIAQLAIERAKRLVEGGEHVFILLDSITRVGRAFNNSMKGGGRTGSGGLDTRALEIPRKLFAAARNTREAGSLTIIATALIETGSRADEAIFLEFKGTGNMELVLDRRMAEQYIYPAINIFKSGTRREELLLPPHQLEKIYVIRRGLSGHKPDEALERLLYFCEKFPNNAQMLLEIPRG